MALITGIVGREESETGCTGDEQDRLTHLYETLCTLSIPV